MNTWELLLCVIGMGVVTALPRVVPLTLLTGRTLPPTLIRCLSFVPVAVLSALLAPELLMKHGRLQLSLDNLFLLAALPTFFIAWRTRSFFGSIAVGMAAVALGRLLGWQ